MSVCIVSGGGAYPRREFVTHVTRKISWRQCYFAAPSKFNQLVTHVTGKILVAAIQTRGEATLCYTGNEAKSRGGQTCYMGRGT